MFGKAFRKIKTAFLKPKTFFCNHYSSWIFYLFINAHLTQNTVSNSLYKCTHEIGIAKLLEISRSLYHIINLIKIIKQHLDKMYTLFLKPI